MGLSAPCCMPGEEQALQAHCLLREVFGEVTAETLQRVADLLACTEVSLAPGATSAYPPIVNLAMILKQVDDRKRFAMPPSSGRRFAERSVLKRAARCAKFVSAARLNERDAIATYVGGLHADDIRSIQAPASPRRPGFLLAVDPGSADIVLAIQHDASAATADVEVSCTLEPFHGGHTHAGMLECARHVVDAIASTIVSLSLEFPRKAIAITGHGLGAGIAVLTTVQLCGDGCPLRHAMKSSRVQCYAFGPPPTFEPLWALPSSIRSSTFAFVHGMDCVPRLCLGSLSKLLVMVRQVDALPLTGLQRMAFLRGSLDMDYCVPDNVILMEEEKPLGSLAVVGTILLIYRGEDEVLQCERLPAALTEQLLVHRDMVNDHIMPLYEQATADLDSSNS
mmetsp:Transcript_32778/g.94127  ORF Transcript_32778/g.94127 Transcript_32778/m.94127 type:complete len:395 (-) Transcript_32778:114-1298(-)